MFLNYELLSVYTAIKTKLTEGPIANIYYANER